MEPKKYEVKIYYSGFCTYEIEAEDESDAITKARTRQVDSGEIVSNLENWEEADSAELVNYENN
jgi:hypothetical protein